MTKAQKIFLAVLALIIFFGLGAGVLLKQHANTPELVIAAPEKSTFKVAPYTTSLPAVPVELHAVPEKYTGGMPVDNSGYIPLSTSSLVTDNIGKLHVALTDALKTGRITLADFEKLHFGGVAGNIDANYAVFNPKGKIAFRPMLNQWIKQPLLDKITTTKNMPLIYNLRRITDAKGNVTDVLYAIIPGMAPQVCRTGRLIYALTGPISFELDNSKILQDDPRVMPILTAPACLVTPDRRVYWFSPLQQRVLRKGSGRWTAN